MTNLVSAPVAQSLVSLNKIAAVAAVAVIAAASLLLTTSREAHADPISDYCTNAWAGKQYANVAIPACEKECVQYNLHCGEAATAPPRGTPPPSRAPVQTPEVSPPPSTVPVATPTINPPAPGAPRNAALVAPPKRMEAPAEAVAAAKSAPATPVNSAKPPTQMDFSQRVQSVVRDHGSNVDVVKADNQALVRPRVWEWVDYDADHHPTLYNPLTEATTFRYFYSGAYREVYVAAGGRVVLDVAVAGVFPFTAVSDSYVSSGSFSGSGVTPQVYQDVSAYVPAENQTVRVGQVTVVGHDDGLPAGSQDIFMLDDSTLAWGQVNDPNSGAQIRVTKTQSVPGVAPIDNGTFLVALAAQDKPTDNAAWLMPLVRGGVLVVGAGIVAWLVIRRKRKADPTASA
jgi:hypothetical protein